AFAAYQCFRATVERHRERPDGAEGLLQRLEGLRKIIVDHTIRPSQGLLSLFQRWRRRIGQLHQRLIRLPQRAARGREVRVSWALLASGATWPSTFRSSFWASSRTVRAISSVTRAA